MMRKIVLYYLCIGLLCIGCSAPAIEIEPRQIDEVLLPYLELFLVEAQSRGVEFGDAADQLSLYLSELEPGEVTGRCIHNSVFLDEVVIDLTYWQQAGEIQREFLIFHELGHCLLQRDHLDTAQADGNCLSIMHSGLGGCRNAYAPATRSDYLDELFNDY